MLSSATNVAESQKRVSWLKHVLTFSAVTKPIALAHQTILCWVWPLSGLAVCYRVSAGALGCASQDPVPQDHHTLVHNIAYAILIKK